MELFDTYQMTSKDILINTMLQNYKVNCLFTKDIENLSIKHRLFIYQSDKVRFFNTLDQDVYEQVNCIAVISCYIREGNSTNYKNIITHLSKLCSKVILVYTTNPEFPIDYDYIRENYNNVILIDIDNKGYDAAKYFTGIKYILDNNIDFDRIILINDSVIFTRSIEDFFAYQQLYHKQYNYMGLNNSLEIKIHFQSYFLSLDRNIAKEYVKYYFENADKIKVFANVVFYFEVLFSDYIINNSSYKSDCFYYIVKVCNPSYEYQIMGENFKYPVFKTKDNKDVNELLKYY